MANLRNELKSRQALLRRLHDDLKDSAFARRDWNADVRARRTLGSDETIEHWFLAEHFLLTWSNWQGLFHRYQHYFGRPADSFPGTWGQLMVQCELLVFMLARDSTLDEIISKSWVEPGAAPDRRAKRAGYDVASIYTQLARGHERAALLSVAARVQPKFGARKDTGKEIAAMGVRYERAPFEVAQPVVFEQNERLMELWQELPRRVRDQVWDHLRHYLHGILGVSWLVEAAPEMSALLNISWRKQAVSIALHEPAELAGLADPISASVARLVERLKTAITEFGYEAVIEDLLSADLIGGEDSLLGTDDVMVVPGHLADASRPILLAATKGWAGKDPQSFAKVMRQVKMRLIEANGSIKAVVVFCDAWDSVSFQEEQREELNAHRANGVQFLFMLVGESESAPVRVPVGLEASPR